MRLANITTYLFFAQLTSALLCIPNLHAETFTNTQNTFEQRLAPSLQRQQAIPIKNQHAEILHSISKVALMEDGHWQRRVYISIRINDNSSARDYGRISIPYNHYYSNLELNFANTRSQSGKITPLSENAIQQRVTGGGQDFYSANSELAFSMPDISPGSIIEFQYTRTSKTLAFADLFTDINTPYWFQFTYNGSGWRADFVHNHSFSLETPASTPLFSKTFSNFPDNAKITEYGHRKIYHWEMKNIASTRSESWTPTMHRLVPTLQLSTQDNWSKIDTWSWQKIAGKLNTSASIKNIITDLHLEPTASNEEKVKAVYAYLQKNIRYVFAHLGRGGYEPHSPDDVIAMSYGDCKDQTVLVITLLKALGVNAYPVLVETPRAGDSDTSTVGLIFDHMMVHIPESENVSTQWLDTTGDQSLYPGVSNYLAGQNAFIVNGRGGEIIRMPDLRPNRAKMLVDYSANTDGSTRADIRFELEGLIEQNLRDWWIHNNDQENTLNQYLGTIFNTYKHLKGEIKHSEDIWRPIEIVATFDFDKEEDSPTYGASVTQIMRMFTNTSNLPLPETKRSHFYDKYPLELIMDINIKGRETEIPALIQSSDAYKTPHIALTYKTTAQQNHYNLNIRYTKYALDLDSHAYKEYFDTLQSINQENTWLIKMLPSTADKQAFELTKKAEEKGKNSVEYLILHARNLINEGNFNEALNPAKKAVTLTKTNGEAWYVLGMAQGFSALIEESAASFEKANKLGYLP